MSIRTCDVVGPRLSSRSRIQGSIPGQGIPSPIIDCSFTSVSTLLNAPDVVKDDPANRATRLCVGQTSLLTPSCKSHTNASVRRFTNYKRLVDFRMNLINSTQEEDRSSADGVAEGPCSGAAQASRLAPLVHSSLGATRALWIRIPYVLYTIGQVGVILTTQRTLDRELGWTNFNTKV